MYLRTIIVTITVLGMAGACMVCFARSRIWGKVGIAAVAGLISSYALLCVWDRGSIPEHITAEGIQRRYASVLAELRRIAKEENLKELAIWTPGERLPWEVFEERLKTLMPAEILEASIELLSGKLVIVHKRPGLDGHEQWSFKDGYSADSSKPRIARGWFDNVPPVQTIEYVEGAKDGSGTAVQLRLSLRLDAVIPGRI